MRCVVAFVCCFGLLPPAACAAPTMETIHATGHEAQRGIGVVRLGEKLAQVQQALGAGTLVHSGTQEGFTPSEQFKEVVYRYRSGSIVIEASFGEGTSEPGVANTVDFISTSSPRAVLFGHRLREGLKTFEPLLKARRWHVFRCHHEVFTTLLPGGPGSGISWKRGRIHEVWIDAGGRLGQECEH